MEVTTLKKRLGDCHFIQSSANMFRAQGACHLQTMSMIMCFDRVRFYGQSVRFYRRDEELVMISLSQVEDIKLFKQSRFCGSFHIIEKNPFNLVNFIDYDEYEEIPRLIEEMFNGVK